jgi:DNA-directed RNA polymerase subunit RPC12/RpoP
VQVVICQHCFKRILLKEGVNLKDVVIDEEDPVLV